MSATIPTPTPLSLRPATLNDLDGIWALETAVFAGEAWSRDMMHEELCADHRCYLVLETQDGELRGYGGLLALGTEGDIQTIAVAPRCAAAGRDVAS
ncbi:hypothetical protein [Leucobacter insecticola]|uniref:hypothetical protein n=1 Tax=Leucobacter insecticola TaxID=2714934 RepID=UPI0031380BEF